MREQKLFKKITTFVAGIVAACALVVAAPTVAEAATTMNVTQTNHTANSVTISWTPVNGAAFYLVPTASGQYAQVTTTSYTITGLSAGCKYGIDIYAYDAAAQSSYDYIAYAYNVAVATTPKVYNTYLEQWKPGTGNPKLSWDYFDKATNIAKFSKPDGYDVEVISNKGKKVLTKTVDSSAWLAWSFNSSKVKNKGFSVRIKPYFTVGSNNQKLEGTWSAWKTIVPQPKVTGKYSKNYWSKTKKVTLKWKKVTGAKTYTIYRKTGTSTKGKFKKVKTVKGTSFSQTVSYSKSYQYYVVANKVSMKVNGKTKKFNSYIKDSYYYSTVY